MEMFLPFPQSLVFEGLGACGIFLARDTSTFSLLHVFPFSPASDFSVFKMALSSE